MTDEEKEKAEKLAAAKKRFEQLKKQKDKVKKPGSERKKETQQDLKEESSKDIGAEERGADQNQSLPATSSEGDRLAAEFKGDHEDAAIIGSQTSQSPPLDKARNRQPSISLQSQLRSSTFRRTSVSQAPISPPPYEIKSPIPPVLGPEGESINEIYRKQTSRLDELEKENKRLAKEARDVRLRWEKAEEELEDLRESVAEIAELRMRAAKVDAQTEEIDRLKHENTSSQRQISQLQSQTSKSTRRVASPSQSVTPASGSDFQAQLDSKSSTIESMEMEISNLRSELEKSAATTGSYSEQVSALEERLERAERAAGAAQRELLDVRKNLERASEKAVKEGSERTSAETRIRSLGREAGEAKKEAEASLNRVETLEKKLTALTTLHKESDGRRQAGERERERIEKEAAELKRKLAVVENKNLRLREEKERITKREASGADDDGVDELEDEERKRLEDKVRGLESEVFNLRRGVWKEKRRHLSGSEGDMDPTSPGSKFDDVDLTGGPAPLGQLQGLASRGQVFTDVLSSGFNALTGGGGRRGSEDFQLDSADDGFDEEAFRQAQEEEAKKRVERVREVKRGLKDWEGWRMDIVDVRVGGGAGEIFDV